jgi:glycosyltransferase involved in cell wall biosynthesis
MRICHIVPSLEEIHGGPSRSVRALCGALERCGHEIELLTTAVSASRDGDAQAVGPNFIIRTFRRDLPNRLCVSAGLAAAIANTKAEVIHHHSLWLRTLHYSRRAAAQNGVPLVISPRGMMSPWAWTHHAWRKRVARAIVHPGALEHASGWHVTSAGEQQEVRDLGYRQPSCMAPNAVDAPTPQETATAADYWHQACPETASRPTALFYGRLHQKKRVLELLDLWLEQAPANWLLLVVGMPEQYTPEMIESYVQRMSAAGRVRAFSGLGRPAPYAIASVFLLPSHNENFGLTIAEAMAHGVPTLVTDTTPWHAINTEQVGWCVPWESFGTTLHNLVHLPPRSLREMGERARTWVLSEYSWDRTAATLTSFYASLVAPATHQPVDA